MSVTSGAVSTRKLIAVALLCGLAILVAGGIQLFRISGGQRATIPEVGNRITVQGVEATVQSAQVEASGIVLVVEMSSTSTAVAVDDVAAAWTVSTGDRRNQPIGFTAPPSPPACPSGPLEKARPLTCSLGFERGTGTPIARFTVAGQTGVWDLGPT